ncbi:hypothetical protein [Sphingomonas sp. RS2018]
MAKDDKQARLAEALRANLRRRKAQARAGADAVGADAAGDAGAPVTEDGADQPPK